MGAILLLEDGCCLFLETGGNCCILLDLVVTLRRVTRLHLAAARGVLNRCCG